MARFRVGNESWELCSGGDCQSCEPVPELRDHDSAISWLRRYKTDMRLLSDLRDICGRLDLDSVHRLDDDEVLELIARSIRSGRLRACRGPGKKTSGGGGSAAPIKETEQEPVDAAPRRKKTWVEFAVVDMEGNPVSNKRYLVMLPDGSLQEGMLDQRGVVRFNNIDPENSVFSLPELDKDAWERVS